MKTQQTEYAAEWDKQNSPKWKNLTNDERVLVRLKWEQNQDTPPEAQPASIEEGTTVFELMRKHAKAQAQPLFGALGRMSECDAQEVRELIAHAGRLADALKAVVNCPDYRGIATHEMTAAREALAGWEAGQK